MEMIEFKNVGKSFNGKEIFSDLNLKIEKNEITVILGESGAGKTTLFNIIANLTDYTGEVSVSGKVSVVFQKDRLIPALTVKENLKLVTDDENSIDGYLREFGLEELSDRFIKTLSGGQKRRVALLRGFLFDSDILLLDEPFNGLDFNLKNKFIEKIRSDERTVLVITHDILEATLLADRIIIIKKGGKIMALNKPDIPPIDKIYQIMSE